MKLYAVATIQYVTKAAPMFESVKIEDPSLVTMVRVEGKESVQRLGA